jgi:hypothetical protein
MALVLSAPRLAAASHKTAAFIWGLSSIQPERAEVVTVRHQRIQRRNPQIHESKDLEPSDVIVRDGIPTTSAVRTVVDVGATASLRYVEHCLDTGLRLGHFRIDEIAHFVARVAKPGRNGIGKIRRVMEERAGWTAITESALEDLFLRVVSTHALPMPVGQHRVFDGTEIVCRADFAYPEQRILIELDSEQYHMDRETFQRDRLKQNRVHAMKWTVYRFTWRQLKDDPDSVVAVLSAALDRHPQQLWRRRPDYVPDSDAKEGGNPLDGAAAF